MEVETLTEDINDHEYMARCRMIKIAKQEVRTVMRARLSTIASEAIQKQSNNIFDRLTSWSKYQEAERISIYLSMPSREVQTYAVVRHALMAGKKVFVPHIYRSQVNVSDKPRMTIDMVHLRDLQDYEELEQDSWGIPTIRAETLKERDHILKNQQILDLVLLPGVAFDIDPRIGRVRRLGHGKGFYDNFLERYQQEVMLPKGIAGTSEAKILSYGLALEEQFLQPVDALSVPMNEQDGFLTGLLIGDGRLLEDPSGSID